MSGHRRCRRCCCGGGCCCRRSGDGSSLCGPVWWLILSAKKTTDRDQMSEWVSRPLSAIITRSNVPFGVLRFVQLWKVLFAASTTNVIKTQDGSPGPFVSTHSVVLHLTDGKSHLTD